MAVRCWVGLHGETRAHLRGQESSIFCRPQRYDLGVLQWGRAAAAAYSSLPLPAHPTSECCRASLPQQERRTRTHHTMCARASSIDRVRARLAAHPPRRQTHWHGWHQFKFRPPPWPRKSGQRCAHPAGREPDHEGWSSCFELRSRTLRASASVFAARTLNAAGQSRVTLSLRLRARQEKPVGYGRRKGA